MSLESILGQTRALRILQSLLKSRRLPPALLFSGPPGVGKKAAALEFARTLNCEKQEAQACGSCRSCLEASKGISPNIALVDASYQAGLRGEEEAKQASIRVETVRHLLRELELRPLDGLWKVAILEDAQLLVPAAANAMLKTMEDPPPRTLWILLTHQKTKLPATVLSRCQEVRFSPLSPALLARLLAERGIPAPQAAKAASRAGGSMAGALAAAGSREEGCDEKDPMAPFRLAESLPRELHLARPAAEERLLLMAWSLRERSAPAGYADANIRRTLRNLLKLRRALDANADPRLVLEIAALELERLASPA